MGRWMGWLALVGCHDGTRPPEADTDGDEDLLVGGEGLYGWENGTL